MPITDLLQTQTFRDWFNKTNEIIDALNSSVLGDGVVANGAFTVNGSLLVVNTFFANSTLVDLRGNTTITANVVVTANSNSWNFAGGSLLLQPVNGTSVNSPMSFTSAAPVTFLGSVTANANIQVTADYTQTGNALFNGTLTSNGGSLIVQQVLFASQNATVAAALTNPEYDDFAPGGIDGCSLLNLTPSIDAVITGIQAPSNFATGSRVLYIQNLSTTFQITLASANTNSGVNNRFKFPNDQASIIAPGGAIPIIWSSVNKQWRALAPSVSQIANLTVTGTANLSGNVIVGGWINVVHQMVVQGNAAITGNLTQTGNASFSGFANVGTTLQVAGNTIIGGWANVAGAINVAGLMTQTGNATFSGFINALSTFAVSGNSTLSGFANVGTTLQVAGNSTFNGTRIFANGQFRADTTNGRVVLPVGANLWAT